MRFFPRSSFLMACLVAGASILAAGSGFDPHLLHYREPAAHPAAVVSAGHDHSATGLETPAPATHSLLCILCASRHITASTSAPAPLATLPAARAAASPLPPRHACDFLLAGPGSPRAPPSTDLHPA